jgi:hypothetical protein
MNPKFSGTETMGWVIASAIFVNAGTNTLFSLGAVAIEIYKKICLTRSINNQNKENKTTKENKINTKPSGISINRNHSQRNFENNPDLISRVKNKSLARSSNNQKKETKNIKMKKINTKPSAVLINQNHPQRNLENNSHSISRVPNKNIDTNISGTDLLNETMSQANVAAPNATISSNTKEVPTRQMNKKSHVHKATKSFRHF